MLAERVVEVADQHIQRRHQRPHRTAACERRRAASLQLPQCRYFVPIQGVRTLSFEPLSRRTWKVFGPDPGVRSKSVYFVCLASDARRPWRYINRSST
jgi:hypothetical protein